LARRDWLALEAWLKQVALSGALRRWFNHDPARCPQFDARYCDELK